MGESNSPDWIAILVINLVVAGFAGWLAYIFAIKKMEKEWARKSKDSRISKATRVSRDVRVTLRTLTELGSMRQEQLQRVIVDHNERLDHFKSEGRLAFDADFAKRIEDSLFDARVQFQLPIEIPGLNYPESMVYVPADQREGYSITIQSLVSLGKEIEDYIDTLVREVEG